jgi:hypothetical protein
MGWVEVHALESYVNAICCRRNDVLNMLCVGFCISREEPRTVEMQTIRAATTLITALATTELQAHELRQLRNQSI